MINVKIELASTTMRKVVAIVGMHRSGTSMLTGSLEEAGLFLGDVNVKNKYNKKGNRESPYLMEFHEQLLEKNGGAWHTPPNTVVWSESDKNELKTYIDSFSGQAIWGFKDPRTLLVLEGWKQMIPELQFVGIFRNPMSVALSLHERNNFNIRHGLNLWKIYNRKLLEQYEKSAFPIIEFVDKPLKLKRLVQLIANQLNLEPKDSFKFFNKKLIHNQVNEELPKDVRAIYKRLRDIALK